MRGQWNRIRYSTFLGISLTCAALTASCGSDDTGTSAAAGTDGGSGSDGKPGNGGDPTSQERAVDFLASYIATVCDAYKPCCAEAGLPDDGAVCTALLSENLTDPTTNGATYSSSDGRACITAIKDQLGTANVCSGSSSVDPSMSSDACRNVYAFKGGRKTAGQACHDAFECAAEGDEAASCAASVDGNGQTTHICQVRMWGKSGDGPCNATVVGTTSYPIGDAKLGRAYRCEYAKGLYCNGRSKKCQQLAPMGAECSAEIACVYEASCLKGKCAPRVALGSSCGESSTLCAAGAYCDQGSSRCVETLAGGAACADHVQCASKSCVEKVCSRKATTIGLLCGGS